MNRSNQFDRTTRDIVNAFLELLEKKPFEKIVVQDIVDTAMINRSTFYHHFPDKYAILEYLQEKYVTEFQDIVTQVRTQKTRDFSQIDVLTHRFFLKNTRELRLLINIRTEHVDFRQSLKSLFVQLFDNTISGLNELELDMISGMFMEFFMYLLTHDDLAENFTEAFFQSSLDVTMALFQLENHPQAKQEFMDLIRRYSART